MHELINILRDYPNLNYWGIFTMAGMVIAPFALGAIAEYIGISKRGW